MPNDPWAPFELAQWRQLPYVTGRPATEGDVESGRAVFFVPVGDDLEPAIPYAMRLPAPGIFRAAGTGPGLGVIVIQAVRIGDSVTLGYRLPAGGNGICRLEELELLPEPDARFSERGA